MRTSVACFALLLAVPPAQAAPAPMSRAVAETEVRLRGGDAKKVAEELRSQAFIAAVLKDQRTASLGCLKGQTAPASWLAGRLKVRSVRDGLRISLENCPAKDALVLLSAVVAAHLDKVDTTRQALREQMARYESYRRRYMEIAKAGAANPRVALVLERYAERMKVLELRIAQTEDQWVAVKPRLVKSGR
jgi:hypothetical protein